MAEYSNFKDPYISGSVAYDYSNTVGLPDFGTGRQVAIPPARKVRDEVVTDTRARAVSEQAVSPVAIVGFALAAILVVFSLFARAQLSQVSLQVVQKQTQLETLDTTHQKLLIQYEYAFNLAEIEDYAIRELGMQQPGSDQMFYINSGTADTAEVVDTGEKEGFLQKVFSVIGEYLS